MTVRMVKTEYFVSPQQECMIVPLWRQGKDTLDIARALSIPECEVYSRLPILRDRQRLLHSLPVA